MNQITDDADLLKRQRQFLDDVERGIREANREILHAAIPELDQQRFLEMAHLVARLRASYLQAALEAKEGTDPANLASRLRHHREAYDEVREAFDALQRAIKRGYVDIGRVRGLQGALPGNAA